MKAPICNVLSVAIPALTGAYGFYLVRTAKGATNMGEALGPFLGVALLLTLAAVVGEAAALVSLARAERLGWLSWLGVIVNAALLMPVIYLLLTADWQ